MTFSKGEYKTRIENARKILGDLDALLVTTDENMRYLTGVDSGKIIITKTHTKFWLNEVYSGRAKDSYIVPSKAEKDCVKNFLLSKGFKKIGIDSISLGEYKSLEPKIRKAIVTSDLLSQLRKIKSKEEIKLLSKAGRMAAAAMAIVDETRVVGMTEFELTGLIEGEIRKMGSEKPPFGGGLLCLSGRNTGYPHAPPTSKKVRNRELLILDLGAVYQGYHSDMTRTFKIGEVSPEEAKIVDLMDWLKEKAIEKVEPDGKISEIHEFIDKEIEKAGYKFVHLSGHGVGLNIHEKPSLGPNEEDVFCDGMVFTIEPGIYTTKFGARSEDTIALVNGKKKILTQ